MSGSSRQSVTGWAAVALQGIAIVGMVLSPGDPALLPDWIRLVGLILMGIGVMVMLAAFLNLGSALTPTPVPIAGAGLRTSGLYALVRHPIYTGLLTLGMGLVLRSPGIGPLFWFLVLAAVLVTKAHWEERMLTDAYPDYRDYMRETGRFLPRLTRSDR